MINTSLQKTRRPTSGLTRGAMLKRLGLPWSSHWEHAAPLLKAKIISARRAHQDYNAAVWSKIKARLKQLLPHRCACGCGELIRASSFRCRQSSTLELKKLNTGKPKRKKQE